MLSRCRCRIVPFCRYGCKRRETKSCVDESKFKLNRLENGFSLGVIRRISFSTVKFDETKNQNTEDRDGRPENKDYELICPITEPYFEQVIAHIRNNFFIDEPTSQMLGLSTRGNPMPIPTVKKLMFESLSEGLSVMNIHLPTNQVAAVAINGIIQPSDINNVSECQIGDEDLRMICNLFVDIHKCLNLFRKYNVTKMFDMKAVSVDSNHRQRGLASTVIGKSIEIAEACGCKVVKTEGTSAFTQKAFANHGFEVVWERNYSAFVCENGDPVFQPVDPHKTLKIMTKIINQDWWSLIRGSLVPLGLSFTILAIFQYFNYKLKV